MAGRGWGKTRTGAEDVAHYALTHPSSRIAVVAPTYADARDTCLEGESGLLRVIPPSCVQTWNRSLGELVLLNGSRFKLFSADEPERLRGPQHHRAWADELAAWRYPETWDQLLFGLRLGENPQAVVTTTPKPITLLRELLDREDVQVTRGSTFENAQHLSPAALLQLKQRYEGTTLGRQELYAEILDEAPGALWTRKLLNEHRVRQPKEPFTRVVVAIDPSVTGGDKADECGVIVAALGPDQHVYVLDDVSMRAHPNEWAQTAIEAYHVREADRVVAEVNNGGELVEHLLRTFDSGVSYRGVHASRGKRVRAEPVAALYEQGRVHHVGVFPELEDQLVTWVPGEVSPDRLDALVWALTDLVVSKRRLEGQIMF